MLNQHLLGLGMSEKGHTVFGHLSVMVYICSCGVNWIKKNLADAFV